ncbi:MAG: twitching motility protein PilT [Gemmatimonas sp. SG8_38_2]|nr:MAG: twitching motility protein PilT [Gemmatimonas sp. SG8_38_2]
MIVLDASAVFELILNTEAGRRVAGEIASPDISLHAPSLLDLEVVQALRRYVQRGTLSLGRARRALDDYLLLDVERHGHEDLLTRIWSLRENLTAYDAVYVVLAEALDARLLTRDAKLASTPGHQARIRLID